MYDFMLAPEERKEEKHLNEDRIWNEGSLIDKF